MMHQEKLNPYPGFDETGDYCEPPPARRVRPEAEEYAGKHKGCINLFISNKHTHVIPPPRSPRCPTGEARQNYEISRTGHIGNLLGGNGQPPPKELSPVPRVTAQSESIAESHKGQEMNILITNYGKNEPTLCPNPRVKHEALKMANLSKGGRMSSLLHNMQSIPHTPRNAPRVKPEAEKIAKHGKGMGVAKIMGKDGETHRILRVDARVKPEGQEMANLDQGGQMKGLFYNYGKQQPVSQPVPKIRDGKEVANLDRGGRMSKLMHESNTLSPDPKPLPRAPSSAGRKNLNKNKGSISSILMESAKWQIIQKPGVRN